MYQIQSYGCKLIVWLSCLKSRHFSSLYEYPFYEILYIVDGWICVIKFHPLYLMGGDTFCIKDVVIVDRLLCFENNCNLQPCNFCRSLLPLLVSVCGFGNKGMD